MGTFTPVWGFYKPSVGETGWGALVDTNFDIIDGQLTNSLPRSYLAGLGTVNNAGAPLTKLDLSAGVAQDAGNAGGMTIASTLTKDISAVWAVGTGNGGLATALGAVVPNTWYHVFLIKRTDTSVVDAYFDTSVTAGNIPSPYTLFRRIASVRSSGASQILPYTQEGDYFRWKASVMDVNTTNPGVAAVTATLASVPTGVRVKALFNLAANNSTSHNIYVSDLTANDEAPLSTTVGVPVAPGGSFTAWNTASPINASGQLEVMTNTSGQLRYRLSASGAADIVAFITLGWTDFRGRNA